MPSRCNGCGSRLQTHPAQQRTCGCLARCRPDLERVHLSPPCLATACSAAPLEWSETVAEVAVNWVSQCNYTHSPKADRLNMGEVRGLL